jgi:hypothetical protein
MISCVDVLYWIGTTIAMVEYSKSSGLRGLSRGLEEGDFGLSSTCSLTPTTTSPDTGDSTHTHTKHGDLHALSSTSKRL